MHWIEKYLFPPSCQLCGATAKDDELCAACAKDTSIIESACPQCALPNDDGSICQNCSIDAPLWQAAFSCLRYQGNSQKLIQQWKYQSSRSAQRLLCETLYGWLDWQQLNIDATAIIAVPMHRKKLSKRGFNAAQVLATVAGRYLDLPILPHALIRTSYQTAQAGLNKQARMQHLKESFSVIAEALEGHQKILLLDDVYTTGSTLHACSLALATAGVRQITVMTLARALPNDGEASLSKLAT